MLTIGKRQGYETETQEVQITYRKGARERGTPNTMLHYYRQGNGQGFETETQEVLST